MGVGRRAYKYRRRFYYEKKATVKIESEKGLLLNDLYKTQIIESLNMVPLNIIQYCIRKCRVKIVKKTTSSNKNSRGTYYEDQYMNNKTIEIKYSTLETNEFLEVLLHELGHMIDYSYKTMQNYYPVSDTARFKRIANKENSYVDFINELTQDRKSSYYKYCTSNKEYFAESFVKYVLRPDELKIEWPKTYEFIDNYVKSLL